MRTARIIAEVVCGLSILSFAGCGLGALIASLVDPYSGLGVKLMIWMGISGFAIVISFMVATFLGDMEKEREG